MDTINNPAPTPQDGSATPIEPAGPTTTEQANKILTMINDYKGELASLQAHIDELTLQYTALTGQPLPA